MMHDNVAQEMIGADVTNFLEESVWKDLFGRTYEEKKSFGYEVSIYVDHPDYFLVANEVGEKTSQK